MCVFTYSSIYMCTYVRHMSRDPQMKYTKNTLQKTFSIFFLILFHSI